MTKQEKQNFKYTIKSKTGIFEVNFKELWQYKDLIYLFVVRNFSTLYKQTILGPLWLLLVPIITTYISTFVFGTIAKISSDGVPYFIFYMCGSTIWTYFAKCLTDTSNTFTGNSSIFGKVYFPRLVMPISTVITGLLNLFIQILMLFAFWIYFYVHGSPICITSSILLIPILIIQVALLGLGCGIIVSSLTTKYRDLTVVIGFGVSLWMYITPIIYPISSLSNKLLKISMLNPMAPVVEIFRNAILGTGNLYLGYWAISWVVTIFILLIGVLLFNRIEKTFMDTV